MKLHAVFWWLGISLIAVAVLSIPPAFVALSTGEGDNISAFVGTAFISSFLGGVFLITSVTNRETMYRKGGIREIVLMLLCWWALTPAFAGLPFLFSGMNALDAWFETVSATTTTGAWLNANEVEALSPLSLWRVQLQWLGGLVSICAAASIFVRSDFTGVNISSIAQARDENESYFSVFRSTLLAFLPVYSMLTAVTAIGFTLFDVSIGDAIMAALSMSATGGVLPAAIDVEQSSLALRFFLLLVMFTGAANFISVVRTLKGGYRRPVWRDHENVAFAFIVILTSVLFVATSKGDLTFADSLLNAASIVSTNGILFSDEIPVTTALVVAVIGGAAVSTAGGVKLLRWLATLRRSGREVWKLIHPRGVQSSKADRGELTIWIHFISFAIFLSALVLCVGSFGHDLELSIATSVAILSNAGPLVGVVGHGSDYDMFEPVLRIILGLAMIIGRLEIVITFALFNNLFWRT